MKQYIIRRLLLFIPTALGVSIFIFSMLHVIPGDYATALLMGRDKASSATEEDFAKARAKLGLDKPVPEQYVRGLVTLSQAISVHLILTVNPLLREFCQEWH